MPITLSIDPFYNTVNGWEKAANQYYRLNSDVLEKTQQFEFTVIIEASGDTRDILNLRYFFPIGRDINRRGKKYRVNIQFISKQNINEKSWIIQDLERIAALLSASEVMSVCFDKESKTAWFTSEGYTKVHEDTSSRASFPYDLISTIIANSKVTYTKDYLNSDGTSNQFQHAEKIFESINIQIDNNSTPNRLIGTLIIREVDSYREFANVEKSIKKEISSNKTKPVISFRYICQYAKRNFVSEIFPITMIENPTSINFQRTLKAYEKYFADPQKYQGTQKDSLSAYQKTIISSQLCRKIQRLTKYESDLVKAIFYFILRNHLDRKEIFNLGLSKRVELNDIVIRKAFADAKTYAEGIYQIIENSCLYSFGKCAYFGMRIHNANRNASMSDFQNESQVRLRLSDKYSICIDNNTSNIFNGNRYADFLELYVIDNAANQIGIIPNFNGRIKKNGSRIRSVTEIFEETEEDYLKRHSDLAEYYLTHYGLRWFKKIISKNNGYIIVVSPSGSRTTVYTGSKNSPDSSTRFIPKKVYYTESSVLLPLSYEWQRQSKDNRITYRSLFGNTVNTDEITFQQADIDNAILSAGENKKEKINLLYQYIVMFSSPYLYFVVDNKLNPSNIEILAKSIFKYVFQTYHKQNDRKLLMVFDFRNRKDLINEFVRIFSVFYDKIGKNRYMSGVQIALASERETSANHHINEINFILGGINYASAYATANIFLYYNSKSTAPFIPLLEYLTREQPELKQNNNESEDNTAIDIFPFDLYLKDETGKSWFIKKMDVLMNQDIRNTPYGCKISNTHINISSRIHLNTFFEAELLFHNIAIVYRFAYLIAQKIITSISEKGTTDNDLLIVGYENYSSVLIQQIAFWVKNTRKLKNNPKTAIIVTGESGLPEVSYCDTRQSEKRICCYTVIPIGTTFSTIYRLHHDIQNLLAKNAIFMDNFAVVSVCDEMNGNRELQNHPLVLKYWKNILSDRIILQPETNSDEEVSVYYLILAESRWYDNETCEICRTNLPLIQADKTSTLPSAIFELTNSNRQFLLPTNNLKLFKPQFNRSKGEASPMVLYSHLYRGNNHYQFYFRFQEFVAKYSEKITKWAESLTIDNDAYNIVVSPLSVSNAQFLKIILDNVFSSSLRLLHIDINNTYKEDIRAKFSYISSDYKAIKELNNNAKIHFYYIDDSIVTGQSINRARMFLKMLIDESDLSIDSPFYFKKIILLINRSSHETVNTFVENANRDLYAFCNISIPSYNTNSNFCPGCAIERKYELLKKRSASTMLRVEFDRLAKKQEPRTPDEYEAWLKKQIIENNSYFSMLREFLYALPDNAQAFDKNLRKQVINYLDNYYQNQIDSQDILTVLSAEHTLTNFFDSINANDIYREKISNLVRFLVAQRAYIRLITMNNAYESLQGIAKEQSPFDTEAINKRIKDKIWKLLENSEDNDTIISYIKVISREHLATYYHIRYAAMEVMIELLDAFIDDEKNASPHASEIVERFKSSLNNFNPRKYQAVIIIAHRLAMLQSSALLRYDTVNKTICFFEDERKYFADLIKNHAPENKSLLLHRVPSQEQLVKQYVKSLKVTTMLDKDDKMCNNLLTLYENLKEVKNEHK